MSDEQPWEDECDNCDHERWHHGQYGDEPCEFGWEDDCDCEKFQDDERDAALAYWIPLVNKLV